jgi:hypothetical protein
MNDALTELDMEAEKSLFFNEPEEVGINEPFSNGDDYPSDINCRCTVIDVIEGLEPELRRTREDGVQPYQTFATWADAHGVDGSRYGERYDYTRSR